VTETNKTPIAFQVPEELRAGAYANLLAVWHTAHEFTLDFAVSGLPREVEQGRQIPAPVVARVKVPPSVIFSIARAIADNVDRYEKQFGAITARPPDISPDEIT
jgi:hypothetical protein